MQSASLRAVNIWCATRRNPGIQVHPERSNKYEGRPWLVESSRQLDCGCTCMATHLGIKISCFPYILLLYGISFAQQPSSLFFFLWIFRILNWSRNSIFGRWDYVAKFNFLSTENDLLESEILRHSGFRAIPFFNFFIFSTKKKKNHEEKKSNQFFRHSLTLIRWRNKFL